jgi:hypothetical protein
MGDRDGRVREDREEGEAGSLKVRRRDVFEEDGIPDLDWDVVYDQGNAGFGCGLRGNIVVGRVGGRGHGLKETSRTGSIRSQSGGCPFKKAFPLTTSYHPAILRLHTRTRLPTTLFSKSLLLPLLFSTSAIAMSSSLSVLLLSLSFPTRLADSLIFFFAPDKAYIITFANVSSFLSRTLSLSNIADALLVCQQSADTAAIESLYKDIESQGEHSSPASSLPTPAADDDSLPIV